jgi:pantoate--beta-alanine ligase
MYAQDHSVWVDESFLSTGLCGKSRPGHFRGVCTIVAKLFNCVTPTAAIFGEKDFQQLAIIRRMVRDLDFPIRIVPHPTIREQDGLAMSSRNVYLAPAQRQQAPALHRALASSARRARSSRTTPAQLRKAIATEIAANAPDAQIDYIEVVDAESLTPRPDNMATPGHSRILAAVYFGTTRLIDNVPL